MKFGHIVMSLVMQNLKLKFSWLQALLLQMKVKPLRTSGE
jgi:hypothetical protein